MTAINSEDGDIARTCNEWKSSENYHWVCALPTASVAWEFLRRNPQYSVAYRTQNRTMTNDRASDAESDAVAASWKLVRFVNPELDARRANIFWLPGAFRDVLPLVVSSASREITTQRLPRYGLQCRIATHSNEDNRHHVLFAQDGRFLQLEIYGTQAFWDSRLTTDVLFTTEHATPRLRALRRLADLTARRSLRPVLYPPEPRSKRLAQVLQVLDGERAGATHRQIAAAIYGPTRVDTEWHHPSDHLRSWVRRTLRRGRELMMGGYTRLLK